MEALFLLDLFADIVCFILLFVALDLLETLDRLDEVLLGIFVVFHAQVCQRQVVIERSKLATSKLLRLRVFILLVLNGELIFLQILPLLHLEHSF